MAFRMGGLFIQARIENSLGTFDIGSNNSFVNSLNSVSVTLMSGGSSQIELNLTPTFSSAVEIIESGFLGFGFPLEKRNTPAIGANLLNGVAIRSKTQISTSLKSSSISVKLGYGDVGADPNKAISPWINGIITFPNISFGEEINITLRGVGAFNKAASNDTTDTIDGERFDLLIKRLMRDAVNGEVKFSNQAAKRAEEIFVTRNQTDNNASFIRSIMDEYNFKFYESGGTDKDPKITLEVNNLSGILNGKVEFTLVMYGQINVPEKVYPVESFETNLTSKIVSGPYFGQKVTNTQTRDKKVVREEFGVDSFKKVNKSAGNSIQGKFVEGKPTKGGATDGPPNLRDKTRAGTRKVTVKREENDNEQNTNVESETNDAVAGSFTATVTCPLIPEAKPNTLIKLLIHTGNVKKDKTVFKSVSGIYRVHKVIHQVSDGGGTTTLELLRNFGAIDVEQENIAKTSQKGQPTGTVANEVLASMAGGTYFFG